MVTTREINSDCRELFLRACVPVSATLRGCLESAAESSGGVYGQQLCWTGSGGHGFWDPDGGDVHLLSRAQTSERGTVGSTCAGCGRTDAAGTLASGAFAALGNFAGGGGRRLYCNFSVGWTGGARPKDS